MTNSYPLSTPLHVFIHELPGHAHLFEQKEAGEFNQLAHAFGVTLNGVGAEGDSVQLLPGSVAAVGPDHGPFHQTLKKAQGDSISFSETAMKRLRRIS
jgi:hypothetical protein